MYKKAKDTNIPGTAANITKPNCQSFARAIARPAINMIRNCQKEPYFYPSAYKIV